MNHNTAYRYLFAIVWLLALGFRLATPHTDNDYSKTESSILSSSTTPVGDMPMDFPSTSECEDLYGELPVRFLPPLSFRCAVKSFLWGHDSTGIQIQYRLDRPPQFTRS